MMSIKERGQNSTDDEWSLNLYSEYLNSIMSYSTDDEFLPLSTTLPSPLRLPPLLFLLHYSSFSTTLPSPLFFLPCSKPWLRWVNKRRKKGIDEESKHCCDFWFPSLNETWLGHDVTWSSLLPDNDISFFLSWFNWINNHNLNCNEENQISPFFFVSPFYFVSLSFLFCVSLLSLLCLSPFFFVSLSFLFCVSFRLSHLIPCRLFRLKGL